MARASNSRRKAQGTSLVELGAIGGLFIIMTLFSLNIGMLALGGSANERACRDAARAAAQGTSRDNALALARASLRAHPADGYFVTTSTLDTVNFVYEDFAGEAPPNVSPFVQVTTSNDVRIPAPFLFPSAQSGGNSTVHFTKTYTFPIVKVQLYL